MNSMGSALFRLIPPYSALFRDPVENKIIMHSTVCANTAHRLDNSRSERPNIGNYVSDLGSPSEIGNRQCRVGVPQSAIGNRKSAIPEPPPFTPLTPVQECPGQSHLLKKGHANQILHHSSFPRRTLSYFILHNSQFKFGIIRRRKG